MELDFGTTMFLIGILLGAIGLFANYAIHFPSDMECGLFNVKDSTTQSSPILFKDSFKSTSECKDGRVISCEYLCSDKSKLGNCVSYDLVCQERKD